MSEDKRMLTLQEACETLKVSRPTFNKIRKDYIVNPDENDFFFLADILIIKKARDFVKEARIKKITGKKRKKGRPIKRYG